MKWDIKTIFFSVRDTEAYLQSPKLSCFEIFESL